MGFNSGFKGLSIEGIVLLKNKTTLQKGPTQNPGVEL